MKLRETYRLVDGKEHTNETVYERPSKFFKLLSKHSPLSVEQILELKNKKRLELESITGHVIWEIIE